jgi:hypothetical protein
MMSQGRNRVLSSLEEIKEIKEPWERLEEQGNCCIFSSYLCTIEWIRNFGDLIEPAVLVIGSKDEIEYIAPLAVRKDKMNGLPVRILGMIGTSLDTSEYYNMTFLRKKGFIGNLDALVDGVANIKWDVLQLRDMEKDDLLSALLERFNGRWSNEVELARPSPIVNLDPNIDPMKGFELRTGRRIRRIIDELTRDSRLETRLADTPESMEKAMNKYVELHAARWESKGGSIFKDGRQRSFLRGLPAELVSRKKAWMMEVLIDGEIASQQLCLLDKDIIRMYRMVMNNDYRQYAPGYLTCYYAMLEAMKGRHRIFDMGPGAEEYKYKVGGKDHLNYAINAKRGKVMMASKLIRLVKRKP